MSGRFESFTSLPITVMVAEQFYPYTNVMPDPAVPLSSAQSSRLSSNRSDDRVEFLGVRFDAWPLERVVTWLAKRDAASSYAYLITPNVDHLIRLPEAEEAVRDAYEEADLVLCDSRIVARLAAWAGLRMSVAPGSDLTALLFAQLLSTGDRVCLIGGGSGDATALEKLHPGLSVIQHCPPMGLRSNAAARARAVDAAISAQARITLFSVGSPQQELLAHEMAARSAACGTGLCIGASTDFLLGRQRRAPRIIQHLSLEWAWRLLTNPRRLARRYLIEGPAIFPMAWRWRRTQQASKRGG